MMVIPETRRVH